jgi:ketosteroid isomerase-like protein
MKSILIASLLVLSSTGLFAEVGDTKGVFDVEKAWIDASGKFDVDGLAKLMRDDFVSVNTDGVVQNVREYLIATDKTPAAEKEARAKVKPTVSTVRVRMYGDTAVVMGSVSFPAPKASSTRFTHVWVKSGDNWYLCTSHVSRIAEPKPAAGTKPAKILKSPKVS